MGGLGSRSVVTLGVGVDSFFSVHLIFELLMLLFTKVSTMPFYNLMMCNHSARSARAGIR